MTIGRDPEHQHFEIAITRRIRQLRKERGLEQKQLARKIGMPITQLSSIESSRWSPSLYTLWRLARGLGVSVSELVRVEDEAQKLA